MYIGITFKLVFSVFLVVEDDLAYS